MFYNMQDIHMPHDQLPYIRLKSPTSRSTSLWNLSLAFMEQVPCPCLHNQTRQVGTRHTFGSHIRVERSKTGVYFPFIIKRETSLITIINIVSMLHHNDHNVRAEFFKPSTKPWFPRGDQLAISLNPISGVFGA